MKLIRSITATLFTLIATQSIAKDNQSVSVGVEDFNGTQITFSALKHAVNTTLSVSGPNGFNASEFSPSGIPSLDLMRDGELADGLYMYEITTATGPMVFIKDTIDNGRGENNSHYARKGVKQSGHFRVVNGQIKVFKQFKEPTANKSY